MSDTSKNSCRRSTTTAILLSLALAGCFKSDSVVHRAGEPDYVRSFDEELMDRAIQKARDTQQEFVAALKNPQPNMTGFAIKKPFAGGDQQEHIWLNDVSWDGQAFMATINNEPVDTKEVKLGDRVRVMPAELSDWMFVDGEVLKGGYTIRRLYAESSAAEKKALAEQIPFKIPEIDF